jgi:oligosaccharide repeat unit polymerase
MPSIDVIIGRTIHGESRKRFLIAFAVACIYSIFATGRTFVILLFSFVTGIALISRRVSPKRVVSQGIIGVIVLFLIFGYLLEKGLNSSIPLTENMPVMAMHVQSYTLGYLSALKLDLDEEIPMTYGVHTFRTVLEVLARLDLGFEARPWGQDIQNVSMQFNSEWRSVAMADHTVYQPYLKDFGILGALIIQLLIGLLHGYLYRNADQGDPFYMILYGLFLYPLLMQFFQDLYFTLLSFWIQITIVIYLHFKAPYALTRKPCNLLTS